MTASDFPPQDDRDGGGQQRAVRGLLRKLDGEKPLDVEGFVARLEEPRAAYDAAREQEAELLASILRSLPRSS